ncbi:LacI family DNA-binding transcriptional regulator [Psychromonas arctica]|uniref:LacI family DNA-binding transcriptional regulator n=1 Tax=Psychromonas arctica TaxID=168275 RepID=UPI00040F1E1A|nr:LacI family DNA-binding transcriptional regulator [Psychromonas arctica]
MNVTFKDVAKLANVSTQTVSRVTNGSSNVAEETRIKVNAAIKELGYIPNKGAQILGRAKSNMIGVVTIDILLHGASLIANGIREQAKKLGYGTSLAVVSTHSLDKITAAIDELKSQRVEFIIMNIPLSKEESEILVERYVGIHFVFIDVPLDSRVNAVSGANYEGAKKAAELMISLQRKRFLVITGPHDSSAAEQRLKGWLDALNEHDDVQVTSQFEGDWQAGSGYLHTHHALTDGIHFDAVLVGSDQMALGVLRALNEFNLSVPQQVSVIGFDDTADSAYFSPPLTTIRQDFLLIGERSVLMALSMAEKPDAAFKQESIVTEVVERKSTQIYQKNLTDKQVLRKLLKQCEQLLE